MPYFKVNLTKKLSPEQADELASGLGKALETVPGKKKEFLILDLEDGKTMFTGGIRQENFAFTEIHYYGSFTFSVKRELTKAVFAVFSEVLEIKPENASLIITEHHNWGGFGDFRDEYYSED